MFTLENFQVYIQNTLKNIANGTIHETFLSENLKYCNNFSDMSKDFLGVPFIK